MYIHTHVYICIYIHTHVCVYIYIYIYFYLCIFIDTRMTAGQQGKADSRVTRQLVHVVEAADARAHLIMIIIIIIIIISSTTTIIIGSSSSSSITIMYAGRSCWALRHWVVWRACVHARTHIRFIQIWSRTHIKFIQIRLILGMHAFTCHICITLHMGNSCNMLSDASWHLCAWTVQLRTAVQNTTFDIIVAIFYPFSQFCEIDISLLSLQTLPNTAPNLFQRGVEYGKYVGSSSFTTNTSIAVIVIVLVLVVLP